MSYLRNKIRENIITPLRIKHISGPAQPDLDREDVIVLCLCRDEDELLPGFLNHYRNLGVKQFVFVDNGSVDKTREIISNQSDCSLFSTNLHFGKYRVYIKRYMIEKFASDHWSLLVDADEFFDYPYSSRISLKELISYLDNHGFNAVNSTMLDMFSTKPLAELSRMTTREFARENYPNFDLENISQTLLIDNLHPTNNLVNKELNHFKGGIRKTFFGTNNTLTKHPLMRFKNGQPFFKNEHMPRKAIIADFSTVLFHYKLIASFVDKAFQYAEEENHWKNSYEYKMYREALDSNDSLALSTTGMEKYTDLEQLVEKGFLITSNQYRRELLGQQRDKN